MKKMFLAIVGASILLGGCATNEAQKAAEDFISEAKSVNKVENNHRISEDLQLAILSHKQDLLEDVMDTLDIKDKVELVETKGYGEFSSELSRLQDLMSYKISSVKMNGANDAEVIADIEYVNLENKFKSVVESSIDREILKLYDREQVSGKSLSEEILSEMTFYTKTLDENAPMKKISNAKVKISKENGEWKIVSAEDSLIDAITLGMKKVSAENLKSKLEKAKENMEFMQIESNFNTIIEELSNKNITVDNIMNDLNKENLSKNLSSKIGSAVIITEKPSSQEGIYYVLKDKGKIKVQVVSQGKDFYQVQ